MGSKKRREQVDKKYWYQSGVRPGWNPKSHRWHSIDGKLTSKVAVMRWYSAQDQKSPSDQYGGAITTRQEGSTFTLGFPTPITNSFEIIEATMAGVGKGPFAGLANILQAILKPSAIPSKKRPPDYMPPQVLARMRLSEHYFATEGDASNICSAPVEILAGKPRSVIVESPNAKHRAIIEGFLQRIRIDEVIPEIWVSMRVYGQAYPYEIVDGKFDLQGILSLSPQHVHRGWDWAYTLSSDMLDKEEWTDALVESHFPDMMWQQMLQHWNDTSPRVQTGLPLNKDYISHISDRVYMPWWRYAMPMLSLGFRDLTSRTIQEDAIRAVTEGYRYQLWVFKLGSENVPPMPDEVTALKNVLGTMVTERTGTLVWKNPLEVEIHVPQGLDTLLASGHLDFLTRQFFRKMGFTPRLLTGEAPGVLGGEATGASGGAKPEIDVQLYLERCRAQEAKIMSWLWNLVDKYLRGTGKPIKDMAKTTFRLAPTDIEMATRIEAIFSPAYRDGVLSERTYLEQMGRNLETEIERKREALPARREGLFNPPPAFAQQVVNQSGQVQSQTNQTEIKPSGEEQPQNVEKQPTEVSK